MVVAGKLVTSGSIMPSCRKLRSSHSRDGSVQTRSVTNGNYSRRLRKRHCPLLYAEEEQHSELSQLHSTRKEHATNNSLFFLHSTSHSNQLSHPGMSLIAKEDHIPEPPILEPIPHKHSPSGRDSVISCESFDSGVSSRSDDDPSILPHTPEKPMSKPITIEVAVSPINRGVIELIGDGSDGFIGYFKPSPSSSSVEISSCSSCALLKRSRVTRSISTNVSEDSNDSAFQGLRSNRIRRDTIDTVKLPSFTINTIKIDKSPLKQTKRTQEKNDSSCKANIDRITPSRKRNRSSTSLRNSVKKTKILSRRAQQSHSSSKKVVKCSSAKRALLRIQHHNRSPERDTTGASPTVVSARNCRTRSHAKSLLKDILFTPTTSNQTSTCRPHHSIRRSPFYSSSTSQRGPNELGEGRGGRISNSKSARRNITGNVIDEAKAEDSGVGSDDQLPTCSSACHWRFCKSEVSPADLGDHIERLHVASQRRNSKMYKCYWEGCKVYGKVAKSIIWLEGHVKKHLGTRPYFCIFPTCTARFPSQDLLQRHVDSHIDDVEPFRPAKKVEVSVAKKNDKKKIKRLRGTEKCIPRRTDFFTSNVLDAVRWEQKMLHEKWLHLLSNDGQSVKLHGQIVAMATVDSVEKVQIHWHPEELGVADSWHDRTGGVAGSRTREVKISMLERHIFVNMLKMGKS